MANSEGTPLPPAEGVIAVPELLETIILHLPERIVLTIASRVCRYWKQLIDDSPSLQQKLSFQAQNHVIRNPTALALDNLTLPVYNIVLKPNPALEGKEIRADTGEMLLQPTQLWAVRRDLRCWKLRIPEMLGAFEFRRIQAPEEAQLNKGIDSEAVEVAARSTASQGIKSSESVLKDLSTAAWFHAEASWRRMFVTQPPCSTLTLQVSVNSRDFSIRDPDGIKLGLIEDLVQRALSQVEDYGLGDAMNGTTARELLRTFSPLAEGESASTTRVAVVDSDNGEDQ